MVWAGLDIRSQYPARALAVQDGSYPTEVATAMRHKRMSEGRWKLNVWTGPQERQAVQPRSKRACRSPRGLLVNKLGSRQAGSRRLKAWSNPRAEAVVRSEGLAPYLGTQSAAHAEGKSPSCARSDLHHLGLIENLGEKIVCKKRNGPSQLKNSFVGENEQQCRLRLTAFACERYVAHASEN